MRIWFSGPRILGGLIRPGVSFGREDLRALQRVRPSLPLRIIAWSGLALLAIPLMLFWALLIHAVWSAFHGS